ncbi:MAG: ATP-dependent DNA helicase RecG [Spirochaetales bacterium]|nr:ATP-dependent DNA helicase RecG [Spirochaetales bacterium]
MFLAELDAPVTALKGIGRARGSELARIGIRTQGELLLHFPRTYEDRRTVIPLAAGTDGSAVNTTVRVTGHEWFGWGKKRVLKVHIEDESARASLVCYGRNFLENVLVPGKDFRLYGTFSLRFGELQSGSFETEPVNNSGQISGSFDRILPVYPLTGELTQKQLRSAVAQALKEGGIYIEDETGPGLMHGFGITSKAKALTAVHFPHTLEAAENARAYLAFEELFYLHLNLIRRSAALKARKTESSSRRPEVEKERIILEKVLNRLPFTLTADQSAVFREIQTDMASQQPMARLLQGDVGSGKTLIAFLSVCLAAARGTQTAFMAPTELLVRQHGENASRILGAAGIRIALLTGSMAKDQRNRLLDALKSGDIDLVIGTHALFSGDVAYKNLGLVIIDEQHRFGVGQRLALAEKSETGRPADFLLMTATPIPRTLAQTLFSDLDVSTIKTMPPGRKPVATHLARMGNEEKVYTYVAGELAKGRQAYFVYPLIEEGSEGLKDAETMYEQLALRYRDYRVGLIHSRLKEEAKLAVMKDFAEGQIAVLAATSVVEVGVDVPNATCMVIEHAERFGLAALHQLRGRVGRGIHESFCFLVYGGTLSEEGKARLKIMKDTHDGFRIAEEDLLIRGPGDVTGTQQSGFLRLRIADLVRDRELSQRARQSAVTVLQEDPGLLSDDNRVYRQVLARANPFDPDLLSGV